MYGSRAQVPRNRKKREVGAATAGWKTTLVYQWHEIFFEKRSKIALSLLFISEAGVALELLVLLLLNM